MKKNYIITFLILITFASFFYGIITGHYEIFPFEVLREIKINLTDQTDTLTRENIIYENDINSLIRIQNADDIYQKQSELINYIWKGDNLPSHIPNEVLNDINDPNYEKLSNLKQIDKFSILMDYDVQSIAYLFLPEVSNQKLIIYHQGHRGDFVHGSNSIAFFLEEGYSVLAFSMPLLGMNNQPIVDISNLGKIKLSSHNHFQFLDSKNFSPIQFFLEPIFVSLNYVDKYYNFESYGFVGISGGGWTATLYPAIDDRISSTYSVAGSLPIFLRSSNENLGDYEQTLPELYNITNYLELYLLNSYGDERKFVQIFNEFDPCCFSGNVSQAYEQIIQQKLAMMPGTFQIFIDSTHKEHIISDAALRYIHNSLNE